MQFSPINSFLKAGLILFTLLRASIHAAEVPFAFIENKRSVIVNTAYVNKEMPEFLSSRGASVWSPDDKSIQKLENTIQAYFKRKLDDASLSAEQKKQIALIQKTLSSSRRQYIGLRIDGKRIIHMNVFPPAPENSKDAFSVWRTVYIEVLDGGAHFWKIEVDLDQQKVTWLFINGEG